MAEEDSTLRRLREPTTSHVAFDLDGVLIDSLEAMRSAWELTCDDLLLDVPFDGGYSDYIGIPFPEILAKLDIPLAKRRGVASGYFARSVEYQHLIKPYPGVLSVARSLQRNGINLSIVTSKPRERAHVLVGKFFPGVRWNIVCPEDLAPGRGKPEPDGLIKAAEFFRVSSKESLYVGDMCVDHAAATSAGYRYLHAEWGYGHAPSGVDRVDEVNKIIIKVLETQES